VAEEAGNLQTFKTSETSVKDSTFSVFRYVTIAPEAYNAECRNLQPQRNPHAPGLHPGA